MNQSHFGKTINYDISKMTVIQRSPLRGAVPNRYATTKLY